MKNRKKPYENVITVTVTGKETSFRFSYRGDRSLMEALRQQDIYSGQVKLLADSPYFSTVCGGRGTCGKCRVRVIEGSLAITPADRAAFTDRELKQGWRLSCMAYPEESCTVRLDTDMGEGKAFQAVTEIPADVTPVGYSGNKEEDYVLGIDIGTTTLAFGLAGVSSGQVYRTHAAVNRQRAYGADVISRIQASNEGRKKELQESIRRDLLQGIRSITEEGRVSKDRIKNIAIAGNTTMVHLLMGFSCETLGNYPYTPVNINTIRLPLREVLDAEEFDVPAVILPGISAFIGGDILAGLLACDFDKAEKPCLFLDLGTNGEMAVGNKDRLFVSSAPAGPALEGGSISCGTGSIPGAICNIELENGRVRIRTIEDKAPVGICGTGVLELVSELLKAGLVDETGLLCGDYFEEGYEVAKDPHGKAITLTQKDIREVQLAKSAIRTGVEILIREYGIAYEDIDTVCLAGGFGYKLDQEKAIHIGLLPKEFSGKIRAVGNSSLGGAVRYLTENLAPQRLEHLIKAAEEVHLSNHVSFQQLYLEHINF